MKKKIPLLNKDGKITGEYAFMCYTSFGIMPEELESKYGKEVDTEEYQRLFTEHKKISAKSCLNKFGHKSWRWE